MIVWLIAAVTLTTVLFWIVAALGAAASVVVIGILCVIGSAAWAINRELRIVSLRSRRKP